MTQNYGGGYSPPATSGTSSSGSSTTEAVRDEALGVGQSAKEASGHVAQTATSQAKQVASETKAQARDLMYEGRQQIRQQARTSQYRAADGLTTIADELRQMANSGSQSGVASEMARQAADRVNTFASWLQTREPGDLIDELRHWARQRPGTFLIGAALAGVVAGRLTSGIVAYQRETAESGPISTQRTIPDVEPVMPATYPSTTAGTAAAGAGYGTADAGYGTAGAGYGTADAGYGTADAGYGTTGAGYDNDLPPTSGQSTYPSGNMGTASPDSPYASEAEHDTSRTGYGSDDSTYGSGRGR